MINKDSDAEFLDLLVKLEDAINEAYKYAEHKFLFSEYENSRKWYRAMKATKAMTEIKLTIDW